MLAIPFVLITTLSGLQGFDMNQERAAQSLGVNRLTAFLKVTAPQIKGSIIAGALFAFISSLDEVVVSLFLSGGPTSTLPKRMFVALRDEVDPTIAAISSLADFRQPRHRPCRHDREPQEPESDRQRRPYARSRADRRACWRCNPP